MFKSYKEAREYMTLAAKRGIVPGLSSVKNLTKILGNPQNKVPAVHVSGTNGKGSVMAYLENILIKGGYKVGRFSSPAVFDDRETIRINGNNISKSDYTDIIGKVSEASSKMEEKGLNLPTQFEMETAAAFLYFANNKCDVMLVECGMGGREDATNIMQDKIADIFVSISLDHMAYLGSTLKEITENKSGIITGDEDVVMAPQKPVVKETLINAAEKSGNKVTVSKRARHIRKPSEICDIKGKCNTFSYRSSSGNSYRFEMDLVGKYQSINIGLAVESAEIIFKKLSDRGKSVSSNNVHDSITKGIDQTVWPGRFEVISKDPLFIIDGAHNRGGAKALRESIDLYFTNKKIAYIMGVLADKEYRLVARTVMKDAGAIFTVTPKNKRALEGERLADEARKLCDNTKACKTVKEAVEMAEESVRSKECDLVIAFGSLSYLLEVKKAVSK